MATLEEASRCPKCEQPGKQSGTHNTTRLRTKVVMYKCMNEHCRWYNTGWPIQINPDGTVPDPIDNREREKSYPTPDSLVVAKGIEEVNAYAARLAGLNEGEISGR